MGHNNKFRYNKFCNNKFSYNIFGYNTYQGYHVIYCIGSRYVNFIPSISLLKCSMTTVNHLHQRSRQKHICTQCDLLPNQWRVQSKNLQWKRKSSSYIADQESLPNKRFEWLSEKIFYPALLRDFDLPLQLPQI